MTEERTKLIYPDGHFENIEGRWKASINVHATEEECNRMGIEYNGVDTIWETYINFFLFDERCWIPMIAFCGIIRPPNHIGELLFIFCEDEE